MIKLSHKGKPQTFFWSNLLISFAIGLKKIQNYIFHVSLCSSCIIASICKSIVREGGKRIGIEGKNEKERDIL